MSRLVAIADAVVAEIAQGTFAVPFTPHYRLLVNFTPQQLANVHVTVVPSAIKIVKRASQTAFLRDYMIDLAIQQHVDPHDHAQCLVLHDLGEAITDFLQDRPLAAAPWARYLQHDLKTAAHPEHLDQLNVFTAVYTLTYRAIQ